MSTRTVIRSRQGTVLGIFPAPLSDHADHVRALVAKNPGCKHESISSVDDPCPTHPSYEAAYCPLCGTAHSITHD